MVNLTNSQTFSASTIPSESFSFSGDPLPCSTSLNQRSTWDILWGCLATIFACSWVAVHPNIPPPNAKWWQVSLTRLELMVWTIVAPELILFWAARQWMGARKIASCYKEKGWTKTHGHFIQMGGFMLVDGNVKCEVLSSERFKDLLSREEISFPEVTEEDIQDRSKGDGLSKGLVILQTTWFITQYVGRILQGLSVTQLELVTLALAALNGFMYFFWWNKPLNVRLPIVIHLLNPTSPRATPSNLTAIRTREPFTDNSFGDPTIHDMEEKIPLFTSLRSKISKAIYLRIQIFFLKQHHALQGKTSVPIWYASGISAINIRRVSASVAVIGVIFGSIHCLGWNLHFPSNMERQLWRLSSLVILTYPASTLLAIVPTLILRDVLRIQETRLGRSVVLTYNIIGTIILLILCVAAPVYVLARLVLLGEALFALRHSTVSATSVVQWTSFLPHI